ncbi:MAG: FG-GAP-like repeat-containing protein, partial [Candidatus Krumholzibacteria bacterium]|nr:FG-GAP-like repeat-containing protein [Candidatus Krumholzibacteria bacterium]
MGKVMTTVLPIIVACVLAGCGGNDTEKRSPENSAAYAKALVEFNRGGALMEQYRYSEAARAYEEVLQYAPNWDAARFNLGLAYLNMIGVQEGQQGLDRARDVFEAVLASDPGHLPSHFGLGLYHQHVGENTDALEHFQAVYKSDSDDPYVAYKCAEALLALGRKDEGAKMLEKVVANDGGFISAVYRLALEYQRTNRRQEAAKLFTRFGDLVAAELSGGSFVVQKTYGTVGKYYQVLGADNLPLPSTDTSPTRRILLLPEITRLPTQPASWDWGEGSVDLPGIATGDVDGDGDLDVCLTASGEEGRTVLWMNDGTGGFSEGQQLAQHGVSPCFGDIDNDGDLDLWLGCAGTDQVFTNDGEGRLRTDEVAAAVTGPGTLTHYARLVDLDSDGDLDFLAFRLAEGSVPARGGSVPASGSVYNSNGDSSYTDIAAALGLALDDTPVANVVIDDFDIDRDLDLVIFPAGGAAPIAWVNDRVGQYRIFESSATGLSVRGVASATSGDPDKDGDRDLLVFSAAGLELHLNVGTFTFAIDQSFTDQHGWLRGTGGQFADMDNDGDLDIVIADAQRRDGSRGPALLVNDWPRRRFVNAVEEDPGNLLGAVRMSGDASCVVADFTGDGTCDILLAPIAEEPLLITNATPGGHWIELDLRGTRERDRKARSNSWAIGARVEIKTGAVFQQFVVGGNSGPVAMSPARIHAGLGDNATVDWLRIVWPDGVLQAELEIAADRVLEVTQLQRKTSSCPYLFAWNGSRFEFVADFGGVGGLGYFLAPGSYAKPDPTEYLRIPRLEPRDGEYVLQCLTPLEEVTYFDEAKLIAVDHPGGTEVYPNEMMAIGMAPPAPEIYCYREAIEPLHAVDHRGVDVTDELRHVDRRCAGATRVDGCFMGLAEDHFVELDFGDRLADLTPSRRLILFLYGWVEYGYSSTNYAAAQASKTATAPSIHVFRDGQWTELM